MSKHSTDKQDPVTVAIPKSAHRATRTYRSQLDEIADMLCDSLEAHKAKTKNDSSKGAA